MENSTPALDVARKLLYHEMANLRATLMARGYGNRHHLILVHTAPTIRGYIAAWVGVDEKGQLYEEQFPFESTDEARELMGTIKTFCTRGPDAWKVELPF